VQASPKRTLTKGGEHDYHTFGFNQLHNCTVVKLLLQVFALVYVSYGEQHCITTLISFFEHQKQSNSTTISADDNQGNARAQSQLVYAFITA
jgi:hypothetical protein